MASSFHRSKEAVTEAQQADYAVRALEHIKNYPYVDVAFWYNSRDSASTDSDPEDRDRLNNYGLLERDSTLTTKPVYDWLKQYLVTGPPLPLGTGGLCPAEDEPAP